MTPLGITMTLIGWVTTFLSFAFSLSPPQLCVHRMLEPGPLTAAMLRFLGERIELGELIPRQPYRYYLDAIDEQFGPPESRPWSLPGNETSSE